MHRQLFKLLCAALLLGISSNASAFVITATLTGDIRDANPNGLVVDVLIVVDEVASPNVATWTVQLNSPLHPDIKLHEFYFNMVGSADDYLFQNFTPGSWYVDSPGAPKGAGAGTATFLFEAASTKPAQNVTNSVALTFEMVKLSGGSFTVDDFAATDFTDAPFLTAAAGSGQLGAHLQSLVVNDATCPAGDCSDSGFAFGSYRTPNELSAPSALGLLGLGLLALAWTTRRRMKG